MFKVATITALALFALRCSTADAENAKIMTAGEAEKETAWVPPSSSDSNIHRRLMDEWEESEILRATDFDSNAPSHLFGTSMDISENTLVIGAGYDSNGEMTKTGAAYVYTRNVLTKKWSPEIKLTVPGLQTFDYFGASVSIDFDIIVVGTCKGGQSDDGEAGSAYVFEKDSLGTWSLSAVLMASDGGPVDRFGCSVAVSEGTVVVGSSYTKSSRVSDRVNTNAGSAYVFTKNPAGTWTQDVKLEPSNGAAADGFGASVAISGNVIVVGSPYHSYEDCGETGAAYIFERVFQDGQFGWVEEEIVVPTSPFPDYKDRFGVEVAISGGTIVVANSPREDNLYNAFIFERVKQVGGRKLQGNRRGKKQKFSTPVAKNSTAATVGSRNLIIGGGVVPQGLYPSFVHVKNGFCGATLIAPNVALGAAHCEDQYDGGVYVGAMVRDSTAQGAVFRSVVKTVDHPLYNIATAEYDAKLIFLADEVNTDIFPPAIINEDPHVPNPQQTENVVAIGMGKTSNEGFVVSPVLLGVNLPHIPSEFCEAVYSASNRPVQRHIMVCAGWLEGTNTCAGDSGGPLYYKDSNTIVGLTSYGAEICAEPQRPTVFTRLSAPEIMGWLKGELCSVNTDINLCDPVKWSQVGPSLRSLASSKNSGDNFGDSIGIWGGTIVVGASYSSLRFVTDDFSGVAHVFQKDDTGSWLALPQLSASDGDGNDEFGTTVAISQDTIVVASGGPDERTRTTGAYIFSEPPLPAPKPAEEQLPSLRRESLSQIRASAGKFKLWGPPSDLGTSVDTKFADFSNKIVYLKSVYAPEYCAQAKKKQGATVSQTKCRNVLSQRFILRKAVSRSTGTDIFYRIHSSLLENSCVSVSPTTKRRKRAKVVQYACANTNNRLWTVIGDASSMQLKNLYSGLCLSVRGAKVGQLIQTRCNDKIQKQKWSFGK